MHWNVRLSRWPRKFTSNWVWTGGPWICLNHAHCIVCGVDLAKSVHYRCIRPQVRCHPSLTAYRHRHCLRGGRCCFKLSCWMSYFSIPFLESRVGGMWTGQKALYPRLVMLFWKYTCIGLVICCCCRLHASVSPQGQGFWLLVSSLNRPPTLIITGSSSYLHGQEIEHIYFSYL